MTLQSPNATLIPLFSSSELTGCGYPALLDREKIVRTCAPGRSRTLDFLRARRAPYPRVRDRAWVCAPLLSPSFSKGIIDRTGALTMLCLTCTRLSSVDLAHYGVSRAKDWVFVYCGTTVTRGLFTSISDHKHDRKLIKLRI